jgi:hypothetical protein
MRGEYTLRSPIVAVPIDTSDTITLPSGARVEVQHDAQTPLVQVKWQQGYFLVHLPDLLDACRVQDVSRITWPDWVENSSAESE